MENLIYKNGWFGGYHHFWKHPNVAVPSKSQLGTSQSRDPKGGAVLDPSEDAFDAVHVGVGDRAAWVGVSESS